MPFGACYFRLDVALPKTASQVGGTPAVRGEEEGGSENERGKGGTRSGALKAECGGFPFAAVRFSVAAVRLSMCGFMSDKLPGTGQMHPSELRYPCARAPDFLCRVPGFRCAALWASGAVLAVLDAGVLR